MRPVPLKLEANSVYVLTTSQPLTEQDVDQIRRQLSTLQDDFGIRFVVLPDGLRITERPRPSLWARLFGGAR